MIHLLLTSMGCVNFEKQSPVTSECCMTMHIVLHSEWHAHPIFGMGVF